jgi:hypothetical protein
MTGTTIQRCLANGPTCFTTTGLGFASHPADKDRAFEWLVSLRERGIAWKAARHQIEEFLRSENARPEHIEHELKRAEEKLRPWLD